MILRGGTSGARARVTNVRLIPDENGTVIGTFHVPDSAGSANPIFETGTSTFRLTGSPTNSSVIGTFDTSAEEAFYSQGSVDATQESTLSMRNAKVLTADFDETQTIGGTANSNTIQTVSGFDVITNVTQDVTEITNITNEITNVTNVTNVTNITNINQVPRRRRRPRRRRGRGRDPLAQTFAINDETGIFITKCDVYFQAKDDTVPVKFEIRTTQLGTPTTTILPYAEIYKDPKDVFIYEDASVATTFVFKSPVYLEH